MIENVLVLVAVIVVVDGFQCFKIETKHTPERRRNPLGAWVLRAISALLVVNDVPASTPPRALSSDWMLRSPRIPQAPCARHYNSWTGAQAPGATEKSRYAPA